MERVFQKPCHPTGHLLLLALGLGVVKGLYYDSCQIFSLAVSSKLPTFL